VCQPRLAEEAVDAINTIIIDINSQINKQTIGANTV
jgi:hypothetical protein